MKRRVLLPLICGVLAIPGVALHAQGVYVTQGPNGPVFSDKPQPGAKEVNLKPLNVVPLPKAPKANEQEAKDKKNKPDAEEQSDQTAAASAYQSLSVLYPENNGSIVANTAVFDVRLAVEPALRLGEGHAFVVSLNGRPVGQRFTATEFMIPPEFWGDTLPPPNQPIQLDASIVDANGQVLKTAAPVRFVMRYATVFNRARRPPHSLPPPPVPPKTPPQKPVKERDPSGSFTRKSMDQ